VLTAFLRSNGDPNRHAIHWRAEGENLGGGDPAPFYQGHSPVTAMIAHNGGVLTAFANAGPQGYRIHWSSNGRDLGGGTPRYEGISPVTELVSYPGGSHFDQGIFAAFSNAHGEAGRHRIHANVWTPLERTESDWRGTGIVHTTNEQDVFTFTVEEGRYSISAIVSNEGPNLDATLRVFNSLGSLVRSASTQAGPNRNGLSESLVENLSSGKYFVVVGSQGGYGDVGQYTITVQQLLAGDSNADGIVDAVDLDNWKAGFGVTGDADGNGDGHTDGSDFLIWQRNLGASRSSTLNNTAIAESETSTLATSHIAGLPLDRHSAPNSNVFPLPTRQPEMTGNAIPKLKEFDASSRIVALSLYSLHTTEVSRYSAAAKPSILYAVAPDARMRAFDAMAASRNHTPPRRAHFVDVDLVPSPYGPAANNAVPLSSISAEVVPADAFRDDLDAAFASL
jgi:hypothetical protein